NK
ncbi:hypothetical protein CFC21_094297, partial [Triticum aestivum]